MTNLKDWIKQNDGYISNLINDNKIIENIKKDDLLIKIPEKLILNVSKFWKIPNIYKWISIDKNHFLDNDINKLLVLLIYEKHLGTKSFYYPYISNLPLLKNFKDYALLNINDSDIETWKDISFFFYKKIENYKIIIENITKEIIYLNDTELIIDLKNSIFNITKNTSLNNDIYKSLVIWAYLIFYNKSINNQFIPYINLLKHNTKDISIFDIEKEYISLYTNIDLSHDDELYINFNHNRNSHYDNKELFFFYNYINLNINYMNIGLNLTTNLDNSELSNKININLETFDKKNIKKYQLINNYPSNDLIYKLRIMSLHETDIKLIESINNDKYYLNEISIDNELEVYYLLFKLLATLKKNYYSESSLTLCNFYKTENNKIISKLSQITLYEHDILIKTIINVQKSISIYLNKIYCFNPPNINNLLLPTINIVTNNKDSPNYEILKNLQNGLNIIGISTENNLNINNSRFILSDGIFINLAACPDKRIIFTNFSIIPQTLINDFDTIYNNSMYAITSDWSMNIWKESNNQLKLDYLPIAINTEKYKDQDINIKNKVFIFYKSRLENELHYLQNILYSMSIKFTLIKYGSYLLQDIEFIKILNNTKYAIWLSSHQNINIHLLQTLSCNIPIFVWDVTKMSQELNSPYIYEKIQNIVTSIPYWDSRCGTVILKKEELIPELKLFLEKLELFQPRQFILDNFDFKKQAFKLLQLFSKI